MVWLQRRLSIRGSHTFVTTGRAAQAGWLLFVLLALSLALSGLAPYRQALAIVCSGVTCLPGQLTPAEAAVSLALGDSLPEYAALAAIIYISAFAFCLLVSLVFIWRVPTNGAAVAGAFVLTAVATGTLAATAAGIHPALHPAAQFIIFVQLAGLLPFLATLPDGRFLPRWLRWTALAAVPFAALAAFDILEPPSRYVFGIAVGVIIAGSAVYRYRLLRRSPQMEGAAWSLAAVALIFATQWMGRPITLLPVPTVGLDIVPQGFFSLFPVFGMLMIVAALTCLAVALLSDELFRVDLVLNRALAYTLLTLFVIGGYALIVGYLSLLFQKQGSLWLALIATGLVAVLFQPLREWVQRFVNGLLYGERDDPYRVIAGLGKRLEGAFEPATVPSTIAETVRESLRLPYAAIALPQAGGDELVAAGGTPSGEPVRFPITYGGETVGYLLVNPRRGDANLSPTDRALLADLAQQAGPAIQGVRLMADLQRLSADLQQSREQLVLAREEERRRLRRDLHNDLAPTLAGLSLRAGAIQELIETDPARAAALAEHLDGAIRNAVSNVRRLVYDLRPPWLDDLGLTAAIRERALEFSSGPGLEVTVDGPETLPPLPAAVEVAAYRIVQEGLMNVVKHADAQNCHIRLTVNDALTIEITDDGLGLAPAHGAGVGLQSIRERAAELGGTSEVVSSPNGGTRLLVSLPISFEESP
jgi:signal transduction histidine kinase